MSSDLRNAQDIGDLAHRLAERLRRRSDIASMPRGAADRTRRLGAAALALACGLLVLESAPAASGRSVGVTPNIPGPKSVLAAIARLPLGSLPAIVSRARNAERGTLTLGLPALVGAPKLSASVRSDAAGRIGRVERHGGKLVFDFDHITYRVGRLELPGGLAIGPQEIKLDPSRPSTLVVNLGTGRITRHFHWILTATDAEYNGSHSLALSDTGQSGIARVERLGKHRYSLRMQTLWASHILLDSWSVGGVALPGGRVEAGAFFDGTYELTFTQ